MDPKAPSPRIPIVPHPRYQAADHYALEDGDASIRDDEVGHYFVCVPKERIDRKIKNHDLVHLEQRRGKLVRTIVRKAVVRGTRIRFASLTPGYETMELKDVIVRGWVVGRLVTYRV